MIPKTIKVLILNVGDSGKIVLQTQSYMYKKNLSENSPVKFQIVLDEQKADWIFFCGNYGNITQLEVVKNIFKKSSYSQKFFMVGNLKIEDNNDTELKQIIPFSAVIRGNPPKFEIFDKTLSKFFKEEEKVQIAIQREK